MSVPSEDEIRSWLVMLQNDAHDESLDDAIGWDQVDRNPKVFENLLAMVGSETERIEGCYMRLVRGELIAEDFVMLESWLVEELRMLYRVKAMRDRYNAVKDIMGNTNES